MFIYLVTHSNPHRMGRFCLFIMGLAIAAKCVSAAAQPKSPAWHDEAYRPQFHFTADKGWLNDPNGLVYYKGEYHLFFQHVPDSTQSVDAKSWGHAVSRDLLHWKQLDEAIGPMRLANGKVAGAWSGTGFVDWNNTGGFSSGSQKPIVLAWTATNFGQCLAYSNDAGHTFTHFHGNPVVPMAPPKSGDWDRDPDVFWYAPARHWVMIFSISGKGFAFNTSTDLRHWTRQSILPGLYECPNCFELPVDGNASNRKWIVWDASGKCYVGRFDGKTFTPQSRPYRLDRGSNYYAAQTWSNAPDGRRIGITWMAGGKFPDMPFNQQLGIPFELALRTIPGKGVRLTKYPVREVESLRYDEKHWENQPLKNGTDLEGTDGDTLDVEAVIEPGNAKTVGLIVGGQKVQWSGGVLSGAGGAAHVAPQSGRITLRILLDRTSIEIFANGGAASLTGAIAPPARNRPLRLFANGSDARLISLHVWRMRSVWR